MALYSGISVMMTLLAFATLLGLANGLKCYQCTHYAVNGKAEASDFDCKGSSYGKLTQAASGDVCVKTHASGTEGENSVYLEARNFGSVGATDIGRRNEIRIPSAGICSNEKSPDGKTSGVICSCNDKDGCNGVGGLGSDVNVILGLGVIALILGYHRQ